mmetsp:Transcript_34417/g.65764  ORF Transcript_34417/g.65764 Transcript_34417/m.65764 type:complete len:238 (+) Transcript_34417:497-1210(+)
MSDTNAQLSAWNSCTMAHNTCSSSLLQGDRARFACIMCMFAPFNLTFLSPFFMPMPGWMMPPFVRLAAACAACAACFARWEVLDPAPTRGFPSLPTKCFIFLSPNCVVGRRLPVWSRGAKRSEALGSGRVERMERAPVASCPPVGSTFSPLASNMPPSCPGSTNPLGRFFLLPPIIIPSSRDIPECPIPCRAPCMPGGLPPPGVLRAPGSWPRCSCAEVRSRLLGMLILGNAEWLPS